MKTYSTVDDNVRRSPSPTMFEYHLSSGDSENEGDDTISDNEEDPLTSLINLSTLTHINPPPLDPCPSRSLAGPSQSGTSHTPAPHTPNTHKRLPLSYSSTPFPPLRDSDDESETESGPPLSSDPEYDAGDRRRRPQLTRGSTRGRQSEGARASVRRGSGRARGRGGCFHSTISGPTTTRRVRNPVTRPSSMDPG